MLVTTVVLTDDIRIDAVHGDFLFGEVFAKGSDKAGNGTDRSDNQT